MLSARPPMRIGRRCSALAPTSMTAPAAPKPTSTSTQYTTAPGSAGGSASSGDAGVARRWRVSRNAKSRVLRNLGSEAAARLARGFQLVRYRARSAKFGWVATPPLKLEVCLRGGGLMRAETRREKRMNVNRPDMEESMASIAAIYTASTVSAARS
eukprot:5776910-Pleurochrysis_carterae.AAC.5